MEAYFIYTIALIHRFQGKEQSSSGSIPVVMSGWRLLFSLPAKPQWGGRGWGSFQVSISVQHCCESISYCFGSLTHQRCEFAWQTCCILLCKIPPKTFFSSFSFCGFILILLYRTQCVQTHLSVSAVVLCAVPSVPITTVSRLFLIHSI